MAFHNDKLYVIDERNIFREFEDGVKIDTILQIYSPDLVLEESLSNLFPDHPEKSGRKYIATDIVPDHSSNEVLDQLPEQVDIL